MEQHRCVWANGDPLLERYHDEEWGNPLCDDQKQFEFLSFGSQAMWFELDGPYCGSVPLCRLLSINLITKRSPAIGMIKSQNYWRIQESFVPGKK